MNDRHLLGIVLSLSTFWLCAQTLLNIGQSVAGELSINPGVMNIIISLASLVCGMFIVVWGALADRYGRVKIIMLGNVMAIIGSLLVGLAFGPPIMATAMLIGGRVLQGMSTAAVMPAALGLINTYWEGPARARALSVFSMGTFGGMALTSSFGGVLAGSPLGWRSIFILAVAFAVIAMLLLRAVPESAPQAGTTAALDLVGTALLAVAMVSFQLVLTQGSAWGWTSVTTLAMATVFIASTVAFVFQERRADNPLIDFAVFKKLQFTGAVLANFLVTSSAGMITVSLWVLQGAGNMSVTTSGYLTLGYAAVLLSMIRAGEKMLNKYGPRLPMLVGTTLVALSVIMLMATNTMQLTYVVITFVAFCIYGLGLALFATPATASALGALGPNEVGVGSGMFKMASSIGSAIGIAVATTVFMAVQTSGSTVIGAVIAYTGRQSNLAVRQAGTMSLGALAVFALVAVVCVMFTIRSQKSPNVK
ncbi:MFS transporter [Corynebacterium uterequi]|uniref:MFS transporter n=1 Tax=Corynebacterium uterequi TaxID=1072256 RepID=UPI00130E54BB|nr:MFS transporter [Corynebacterium uterequi]